MRRLIIASLCLVWCLPTVGCAGFMKFRRDRASRRLANEARTSQIDTLWKQGYGFNNPNNDRVRQDLEPLNFDGKTDKERRKENSFFGELVGDLVSYGIKSSFAAIKNGLKR